MDESRSRIAAARGRARSLASLLGLLGPMTCGVSAMATSLDEPAPSTQASSSLGKELDGVIRVMVEAERAGSIEHADALPEWIRAQHPDVVEQLQRSDGREQWVYVWIGGKTFDYFVSVVPVRSGAAVGGPIESFRCACDDEDLIEELGDRIDAAVASLQEPPLAPTETTAQAGGEEGAPTASEPAQDFERPTPGPWREAQDRSSRRMGPRGYAGIGLGALGVGALVGGIVLTQQPTQTRLEGGSYQERSLRNAGVAVAVGGGAALVAGVTLLVVDLVGHQRRSLAVAPTIDGRLVGLSVTRGF